MFKKLIRRYKEVLFVRKNFLSLVWGIFLFVIAVGIQTLADRYVGFVQSLAVPDLILDHIPSLHIGEFIIQSVLWLTVFTIVLAILKPKYVSFGLKTLALFLVTRAILISLTHLGTSPQQLVFNPNSFGYGIYNILYNSNNDFFFSAHTGVPVIFALIFWEEKKYRYFYITMSILFGGSVLLAHMHYSIDVFAAPFISYGIFQTAKRWFKNDYKFLENS
jgi:hypothetical protein